MDGGFDVSDFYSQKGGLRGFSNYEQQGGGIPEIVKKYGIALVFLVLALILFVVPFMIDQSKTIEGVIWAGSALSLVGGAYFAYRSYKNL